MWSTFSTRHLNTTSASTTNQIKLPSLGFEPFVERKKPQNGEALSALLPTALPPFSLLHYQKIYQWGFHSFTQDVQSCELVEHR